MSSAVQQQQQQYEQYNPNQQQQQLQQQQQHYLAPQERPQQRTRSKSGFSIKSDKSDAPSFGSKPKYSFKEAKQSEKKSRFGKSTKVDPNKALAEAQPGVYFYMVKPFCTNKFTNISVSSCFCAMGTTNITNDERTLV